MADILALGTAVAGIHGPVRILLGLLLGFVIPGWSVVGLLHLSDTALEIGLSVATSLALLMAAAQVLMTFHAWHLALLQVVVCVACIPPLVWQSFGGSWGPRKTG